MLPIRSSLTVVVVALVVLELVVLVVVVVSTAGNTYIFKLEYIGKKVKSLM